MAQLNVALRFDGSAFSQAVDRAVAAVIDRPDLERQLARLTPWADLAEVVDRTEPAIVLTLRPSPELLAFLANAERRP